MPATRRTKSSSRESSTSNASSTSAPPEPSPEAQLRAFVERFAAPHQKLFGAVRSAIRKRLTTANELVYDYGHSVVTSYAATERGIDAVVAISLREAGVSLYVNGESLPDPTKRLRGSGKQARFVEVTSAKVLAEPDVVALVEAAMARARVPLPTEGKGRVIVRTDSAKKKARR